MSLLETIGKAGTAATFMLCTAAAAAQTPAAAALTGTVTDMSGALVPAARVHVERQATTTVPVVIRGAVTSADVVANNGGEFEAANLEPGTYIVTVTADGLGTFKSAPTLIRAGEVFEIPEVALPTPAQKADVTVTMTEEQLAEVEMKAEEHQRVLAVFPNFYTSFVWDPVPLNTRQKFDLAAHSVIDPVSFATSAGVAGIEQYRNTFKGYGDQPVDYFKRFGAAYGDQLFGRIIGSAVFPVIFHQDPRYFYMGPNEPGRKRFIHAIEYSVIVRGDNGRRQPAWSHLLGNAAAGALSTTYHPGENAGSLAARNAVIGVIGAGVQGLVREFVFDRFTHGRPAFGKGKPPDDGSVKPTNVDD